MNALTALCAICDQPCTRQQWACWYRRDDGRMSRVRFCCSERCLRRHDQIHWSAGPEVVVTEDPFNG